MNFKLVFNIAGKVLLVETVSLFPPLLVALIYRESPLPFLYTIGILLCFAFTLCSIPYKRHFFAREGFFSVGLIWLLMGFFGALPFYFCGQFPSFIDCLFETFSGFTTTGATILTDIEALPKSILFWRAFTHWLGGMGVLVLTTALLPSMGIRSHFLTQAESPGPVFSKLVPKQSQTSKILYSIYCAMTAILSLALLPIALLKKEGRREAKRALSPCALLWMALLGAAAYGGNFLQLLAADAVPASVQFPLVSGGVIVLSAVASALFFREKLSLWEDRKSVV